MDGFILLHRKLLESWIWQRSEYLQWFIFLIFKANFKDNDKFLFEGKFMKIKRGQFITSYRNLAKELPKCSEQKIRTFLKLAKSSGAIEVKSLKKATQITICNYDSYQSPQHSSNTVATQQQHNSNTVATTIERKINKDNNDKEGKINNKPKGFNFDFINNLNLNGSSEKFKEILIEWLDYKKEIKNSYKSQKSIETFFKQLLKFSNTNTQKAKEIIDYSIANNYKGIFEQKNNIKFQTPQKSNSISQDSYEQKKLDPNRNKF